ncbi:glycoprotein-N-acetylgalactosamine 3-beta-galactosyltransferase 1-like [Drosophila tropicalis]|uniref:glycoprotein-N-acetylgalactosamine 3-beta-galactosyltransferase 1-like n=1 Tax=Drosophila tropicalis TaxID=46794 RepID=UPI0035AB7CC0
MSARERLTLDQYPMNHEAPRSKLCSLFTLIVGLIAGICLAQFFETPEIIYPRVKQKSFGKSPQIPLHEKSVEYKKSQELNENNSIITDKLKKEVRILCWVMTNPKNHKERALHVKRTWGKRCNILLFMSSEEDEELPTVKLNVSEGRENLWRKVQEAFKYVYKHHYNDADWFYKADDDTYAVVENLRYMLYPYNPQTPVYFGCKFSLYLKQGFMSGGAGYVFSREALRQFVQKGLGNPKICYTGISEAEDFEVGRCMENLNVTAGDSRDPMGHGRMFPFIPEEHLFPHKYNKKNWYWTYQYYKTDEVSSNMFCQIHIS